MSGTPRRHGFIRVGLLLSLCAVPLAAALSASNLPACGQTCIDNEIALASSLGCSSGNNTCLCNNSSFGYGIRDCAEQTCPTTADVDATISYANSYCAPILSGSSLIASPSISSSLVSSSSHAPTTSKPTTTKTSTVTTPKTSAPSSPTLHSASVSISSPTSHDATTYTTYTAPITITFTSTGSLITATYQSTSFITNLAQYLSLESSRTSVVATTSVSSVPASSVSSSSLSSSSSSSASAAAATAPAKGSNGGGGGLGTSAKVGIGVGVGIVGTAVIIGLVVFLLILRRSRRTPVSELAGDTSSKGTERSEVGNGRAYSYNYKTGYDPAANLGGGEAAAAGGSGAYSYKYGSGYDRGGLSGQDSTGQDSTGQSGGVGGQSEAIDSGQQRHESSGALGQGDLPPGEPPRSDRAPDQRLKLDLNLGEKW